MHIEQLIDADQLDEAGALLEEIDVAHRSAGYASLLARSWRERGDPHRALGVTKEYLRQFPGYLGLIEQNRGALIDLGELSRLHNAASAMNNRDGSRRQALFVEEQCAYLENDIHRAIELLKQGVDLETDKARREFPSRLYEYLYLVGEEATTIECLEWYLDGTPGGELEIWGVLGFLADYNEADFGERQLTALREKYPTSSSLFVIHMALLRTTGRTHEIGKLIDRSRELLNPRVEEVLAVWLEGTGQFTPGDTRGVPVTALADASISKDLTDFVAQHGLEVTRAQIERVQEADKRAMMREHLASIPGDSNLQRPLVDGFGEGRNWCSALGENAVGTAVIFSDAVCGTGNLPLQLFDRYLAALNMDAVYLRDPARHFYGRGVPGLCQSLHDIPGAVEKLSVNHNFFGVSFSTGSFGLVGYLSRSNLRGLLVLQGFTEMFGESARYRGASRYLNQQFPQNQTDWLLADGIDQLDVPCHFVGGKRDPECFPHMMRMTCLPNVQTTLIENANHHSLCPDLITSGRMLPMLARAFGLAV